jgi:hypothetical protein
LKYIHTEYRKDEELYDLSSDPYEQDNLLTDPERARQAGVDELRDIYHQWSESARPLPSHFDRIKRKETLRQLKSLGYIK